MQSNTCLVLAAVLSCVIVTSHAHGMLRVPPSRGSMWRDGFGTPINYDDNALYCGGFSVQWNQNGGKCGVCGDNWADPAPRAHEDGGKYGTGTIASTYTQGQIIDVRVDITASHMGWFEFRLCPHDDPSLPVTQACLDQNLLYFTDGTTRVGPIDAARDYNYQVQLPAHVSCTKCVLQWKYNTGNSWGTDPDGTGCIGCGRQEQFYGCSDVTINPAESDDSSTATMTSPTSAGTESADVTTNPTESVDPSLDTESTQSNVNESQSTATESSPAWSSTESPSTMADLSTVSDTATQTINMQSTSSQSTDFESQSTTLEPEATPTESSAQCVSFGLYQSTAMDQWCQVNCALGFCPGSHCSCGGNGGNTETGCYAVRAWAAVAGMDAWCVTNCAAGYCPASHCSCGEGQTRRKRSLDNLHKPSIARVHKTVEDMLTWIPAEYLGTAAGLVLLYVFIKCVLPPAKQAFEAQNAETLSYSACQSPSCVRCQRYNELRHNAFNKLSKLNASQRAQIKRLVDALNKAPLNPTSTQNDKAGVGSTSRSHLKGDSKEQNGAETESAQRPNVLFIKDLHATPWWEPGMDWMSTFYIRARLDSIWRDVFNIERNFDEILTEYSELLKGVEQEGQGWSKNSSETGLWYTYYIYNQGQKVVSNAEHAPVITRLVERDLRSGMTGCVFGNAFVSVMAPGTRIEPHYGPTNVRLRSHLGLNCPPGWSLTVDGTSRDWHRGHCFIFDDSFLHSVAHQPHTEPSRQPDIRPDSSSSAQASEQPPNQQDTQPLQETNTHTDIKPPCPRNESQYFTEGVTSTDYSKYRAVLILDLWHPEVSITERGAILTAFS